MQLVRLVIRGLERIVPRPTSRGPEGPDEPPLAAPVAEAPSAPGLLTSVGFRARPRAPEPANRSRQLAPWITGVSQ